MGVQTLHERYFTRVEGEVVETPQAFWMRVAMGVALAEEQRDEQAIRFYELISSLRFVPCRVPPPSSTPARSHSQSQSSCYLTRLIRKTTSPGDLQVATADIAKLSKWSLAASASPSRATCARQALPHPRAPTCRVQRHRALAQDRQRRRPSPPSTSSGQAQAAPRASTWRAGICRHRGLPGTEAATPATSPGAVRTTSTLANWVPDLFMQRVRGGPGSGRSSHTEESCPSCVDTLRTRSSRNATATTQAEAEGRQAAAAPGGAGARSCTPA